MSTGRTTGKVDILKAIRSRQTGVLALCALWVPLVWLLIGFRTAGPEFGALLIQLPYGIVHLWVPSLWAGALFLTGAVWLLARSVGGWAVPAGAASVLLCLGFLVLSMIAVFGIGYFGTSEPTAWQVSNAGKWMGVYVAAASLPAWGHLAIMAVVLRLRTARNEKPLRRTQ